MLLRAPKTKVPEFLTKRPGLGKVRGDLSTLSKEELAFVQDIKAKGHLVDVVPRGPSRTPDFKINGVPHELKTVSKLRSSDPRKMSDAISNRISNARGQSPNVIIDARQQANMTEDIAKRAIERAYSFDAKRKLSSVTVLTKNGHVYIPRGK